SNPRNQTSKLRRRCLRKERLETGARTLPVTRHFIKQAEVHVDLDQFRIELRSSLEISPRSTRIVLLNGNQSHAVLCTGMVSVVGENPSKDSFRVGKASLLEIGGREIILAVQVSGVDLGRFLILDNRRIFVAAAQQEICDARMETSAVYA